LIDLEPKFVMKTNMNSKAAHRVPNLIEDVLIPNLIEDVL